MICKSPGAATRISNPTSGSYSPIDTVSRTLFAKVWDQHVVKDLGEGWSLLHIDRHVLHELVGGAVLSDLRRRGLTVAHPSWVLGTADHGVSTAPGRTGASNPSGATQWKDFVEESRISGIYYKDVGQPGSGIVHVISPELGFALPGSTVVCTDSHTCTIGALGAIAFGVGNTEAGHVLATQTLRQRRPRTMRVIVEGELQPLVTAKDVALFMIAALGVKGAEGCAIEYAGSAVRSLDMDARFTLCNMSIEAGAKIALIAPDEKTFEYLEGREFSPKGELFERAVSRWRDLFSDHAALFDIEHRFDAAQIQPQISWGTNPAQSMPIDSRVPDPLHATDEMSRQSCASALKYIGLTPGEPILDTPIDWVFIGSCTNSRLDDIRLASLLAKGRRVANGVKAWVVPGSLAVKLAAEAQGLDRVLIEAGFEWREPGCSMCATAAGERLEPGQRCVSTSNRNFVGRQGTGSRTHLASPATAVASAIRGCIADPRSL